MVSTCGRYSPDPNAFKAGVEFSQMHPNFVMQQAVVSDFSGPAKVYMVGLPLSHLSPFLISNAMQ
jgi:hypothetical protein